MNRKRIPILLLTAIIGGSSACHRAQSSSFYSKFSMRLMATSSKSSAILPCDFSAAAGGGGEDSIFSTRRGFAGINFESNKSANFSCGLRPDSLPVADEERLLVSLRQQVEDSLRGFGANIKASGNPDGHSFYFNYALEDLQGRIQVTGKRLGARYNLQAEIQESNRPLN